MHDLKDWIMHDLKDYDVDPRTAGQEFINAV